MVLVRWIWGIVSHFEFYLKECFSFFGVFSAFGMFQEGTLLET